MKFQTVSAAVAAVALTIAAQPAQSIGVCYDPSHVDSVTADTISADFQTIKEKGFDLVRTYITTYGSADLATLAIAQGLNVSLGVPYDNDSPDATATYVEAAISAAALSNGTARVVQIFVGNENLASVDTVPSDMVSYITQLQDAVDVPVGTVQRNTELLDSSRYSAISGLSDLLSTCEVVGVNIQPVFTSNTEASAAIDLVTAEWEELQSSAWETLFPGLADKLSITEAGWPTDGTSDGNTGSVDGAKTFYDAFNSWVSENLDDTWQAHYFQMFDISSASASVFDPYFGLLEADGTEKFTL